jgi:hypothetical protein
MKYEEMEKLLKPAAKKYSESKKIAKKPETQFTAGAMWLWNLLKEAHDVNFYEEQLRQDVIDRLDKVEPWQESLITELAEKKVRLDELFAEIESEGYLLTKFDKNMNSYKESNPLLVHTKELERTIGMWREHLGLSFKVNPNRMKESPKAGVDEDDPMKQYYNQHK